MLLEVRLESSHLESDPGYAEQVRPVGVPRARAHHQLDPLPARRPSEHRQARLPPDGYHHGKAQRLTESLERASGQNGPQRRGAAPPRDA